MYVFDYMTKYSQLFPDFTVILSFMSKASKAFQSYELKSIRKPRRSTLLYLCNAKCDSYSVKCYITSNPKLPNIATLLEPTIGGGTPWFSFVGSPIHPCQPLKVLF